MQDTQPPPCFIFDLSTGKWCPFNTLIIDLDKENNEFFRYRNFPTKSDIVIRKTISYDYIAYYIKSVPSHLKRQHPSLNPLSTYLEYQSVQSEIPTAHKSVEIGSIIMLEDLPLRYGSVVQEDQYILLGFDLDSYKYDEANHQVKYIRDLIADLHMKLKYSEEGLGYQVTKRLKTILYKTMKYSLVYIADLMNIPQELPVEKKLQQLHKISFELAFQDFKTSILKDSKFNKEVVSIAYKTIMMVGLFPAYVELNTMDEAGILLKVKNWLTNSTNAPYGASHHASFSLGNFRYSFIFDLMNKDKQKVNITEELRRGFSLKNQAYEYFRVKFFDFFPMDSWVTDIANRAIKLLPVYFLKSLEQVPDDCELYNPMKNLLVGIVEDKERQEGRKAVTSRIAREFYHRYGEELDHSKNGKIFKKITKVISDAELRGYKNLRNNCQTIVLEIIELLGEHLKGYVEPLMDLSQIPHLKGDDQHHVELFLKFGSQFNKIFTDIGPFPLNHRLSYFDTFSDKDSCILLYPNHFENLRKRREQFFDQENVREILGKLEEALAMAPRIHVKGSMPDLDQEPEELSTVDFKGGEKYGVVSCLIHLIYNELFDIRREIKIARECQENFIRWQEDGSSLSDKKTKKKEVEEWQMMIDRLPMLYKEKYSLLDVYKELCFYYYNTVRLGIQIKVNDSISCLGFLLIRKPDVKIVKDHEEDEKNRRNSREIVGLELVKRLT